MVSAFATGCGISLAQIKVNEKSNEITAIPELLDMLDSEGCTISTDVMGCRKDIASRIISKKADYILAIKDNQPTLRPDSLWASKHCPADDDFTDTDAGHGRVETRRTGIYRDTSYISQFRAGARAIIRVDSTRYDKTENKYSLQETRFYITSLTNVRARDFSRWIRSHRGIENQLYRVLDMAFHEDRSQKRAENSAENFSGMLRHARNILRRYKGFHPSLFSYRSMMLRAALNPVFASEVIQAVFA